MDKCLEPSESESPLSLAIKRYCNPPEDFSQYELSKRVRPLGQASPRKADIHTWRGDCKVTQRHKLPALTYNQGLTVIVTTKAGDLFEGLMAGSSLAAGSTRISLKMTKKLQQTDGGNANGTVAREAALTGTSPEHTVTFDVREITDLQIPAFRMADSTKVANGK